MTYRAGVVGAAGFAGIELVRLLLRHPEFDLALATSDALAGTLIAQAYPAFSGVTDLAFSTHEDADFSACDVVFLAVPHKAAMGVAPALIASGVTVVDLSADFRLKDPAVYEQWYAPHTATDLLATAAFGLPELTGEELAAAAARRAAGEAVLVGCAGCYPTATSLAAAPAIRAGLVDAVAPVVADAISGVTGAGKKATERTHFCFANENAEAYGVGTHRHTPEIEQILGLKDRLVFTPHLAPLNRGLLSTVTLPMAPGAKTTTEELVALYRDFYAESPLVTVMDAGVQPRTASVAGTVRAQVGVVAHPAGVIVATGAIDNLGKGAAGQAVQCANIVFGLPETCGLEEIANPV
ncbi:N-acetyl-gamma-glutamyl-phosphate reductase [uncultured Adlercreutzia sp.]|uniref:N-acetyl-gamma-glutamyl-phosphate reductase n=1 Tax=uncultured Adlercreutzia sp. TaxID=875803 RepID=UPI0025E07AA1|nr:N-acetyl-gamma-glutamyl-phosphate reductase [uncultured Adlercreutzia sp.]